MGNFVTGIVLAAGTSSRLGRPKQLLDLAGKPALQYVVDVLEVAPVDEIVVVLGHHAGEIAAALATTDRTRMAVNADFAAGQSTSFRTGLRSASERSQAAVILLGDQPSIRMEVVAAVVDAWRGGSGPVVQAAYGDVPGHPVLFDRSLWPEIERGVGDEGARGILAAHPEWQTFIDVGGTPPRDIDTEEDYALVRAEFEQRRP